MLKRFLPDEVHPGPLLMVACALLLFSCAKKDNNNEASPRNISTEDSLATIQLKFSEQIEIEKGVLLFPLRVTQDEKSKGYYKETPPYQSWNIVFLDSRKDGYHLLTEEKILIDNYFLGSDNPYGRAHDSTFNYIFYIARTEDYNNDGLLSNEDPRYLFASDKEGRNFRQISPPGFELDQWTYVPSTGKVIITVTGDSDGDKEFDNDEESFTFVKSMGDQLAPREIFSRPFLDSLLSNYARYWKKVKR